MVLGIIQCGNVVSKYYSLFFCFLWCVNKPPEKLRPSLDVVPNYNPMIQPVFGVPPLLCLLYSLIS